jgi:hypothetical protein
VNKRLKIVEDAKKIKDVLRKNNLEPLEPFRQVFKKPEFFEK